jgi:hypothetical protein
VITDVSGKVVSSEKMVDHQKQYKVNTAGYSNGIYFISVNAKDAMIAESKFVVSH